MNFKVFRVAGLTFCVTSCLLSMDCGGSAGTQGSNSSGVQVQFTTPSGNAAIDEGQSLPLMVSVTGDTSNQGVTWSLQTAKGKPEGDLTNESATGATYEAPASVTSSALLTAVATSVADPKVSAALPISVAPLPQITSGSPTPGGCPATGTVIAGLGSGYGTVWTSNSDGLTYYLEALNGTAPYTWSIASGSLPVGLTMGTPTSSQTVIYGTATTPGCSTLTLQLTDAAGATVTEQYYIVVLPPSLIIEQGPLAVAEVGVAYPPTALVATTGTGPYGWTLNVNDPLPPGLALNPSPQNSANAIISGTPSSAGLAEGFTPNVLVYDSETPYPATAQPNISITQVVEPDTTCHTGAEANLNSSAPYAFLLRGFDANGPVVIGGNFSVDGSGNVLSGVEDINRAAGAQTNLNILAGSSYTLGADNRGCVTLMSSAGATTTFRIALGGCSTSVNLQGGCENSGYFTSGRLLEDDSSSSTRASGILRLTDNSAFSNTGLSGLYAFGLSGWDYQGDRYALAGSGHATSGTFASVAADINNGGVLSSSLTGGTGTFSIATNGRGTGTLGVGPATLDLAIYVVSATEAIFITTDTLGQNQPMLGGQVFGAPGAFSAIALRNSYLLRMGGVSLGAPDSNIGVLTFDGASIVKGTLYENAGGTVSTLTITGNYAVDSGTGRLTLTGTLGPHPPMGYVVSAANGVGAFLISSDPSAQAGELYFQGPNPLVASFSNLSLEGPQYLGTDEDLNTNTWNFVGAVSPNGNGLDAGCLCDVSLPGAGLNPNQRYGASYSVTKNGTGTFGGETVSVTNGTTTFYIDVALYASARKPLEISVHRALNGRMLQQFFLHLDVSTLTPQRRRVRTNKPSETIFPPNALMACKRHTTSSRGRSVAHQGPRRLSKKH